MSDTGYPGKKAIGIGGASIERVEFEAAKTADEAVLKHQLTSDPHPQYANQAPRFVTYWKWS